MRRPRTGSDLTSRTVFIRLNAEAFVKFLAFPMRRLLLIFASICGISSRAAFNRVNTVCVNKVRYRYLFQTEKTPLKNEWSG